MGLAVCSHRRQVAKINWKWHKYALYWLRMILMSGSMSEGTLVKVSSKLIFKIKSEWPPQLISDDWSIWSTNTGWLNPNHIMGQLSTTFQFVGTCILFVFHTEQFLGVLGVDRNSFEVFHKDPSRRNVFLQTLEVDKIESRWIFRLHWTTQYLICCSRTQPFKMLHICTGDIVRGTAKCSKLDES